MPQPVRLCVFVIAMLSQPHALAEDFRLPPVRWWGEIGYDYRLEAFEEGDDLSEHAGILKLNASSYLYQPWLATVEGGLGLNLRRTDAGDSSSDNDTLFGDGRLRLFPQSRFPFEAFAEKTSSDTDTDLTGLELDRTRYGFLQRYTSKGGTGLRLGYERSEVTNRVSGNRDATSASDRKDITDLLRVGLNRAFDAHSITFDANINNVDIDDSRDRNRSSFSMLRHTYRPGPALSSEDMLSYNLNDVRQGNSQFENGLYQLNSYAFWRPQANRDLRVNASLRALMRNNETQSSSTTAYSITPVLGATYQWGPRWVFNGGIGGTGVDTEDARETSTFQNASAIYTSDSHQLKGFDASWFGQLSARNNTDEEGAVTGGGADIGYNLGRSLPLGKQSSLRLDFRQSVSTVADTDDFSAHTLLNNFSAAWGRNAGATSSMVRLTASDSRTWASGDDLGSVEGNFQIVNFQASLDHRLSSSSALLGNMTMQATRNDKPAREGIIDESDGEWTPTATVDMTYFHRNLFGVPRLTFRSTARFISDSYFPVLDETRTSADRDDKRWENRLEYTIGRLQLRGIARVSRIQDLDQAFLLFQVRRMFGDR